MQSETKPNRSFAEAHRISLNENVTGNVEFGSAHTNPDYYGFTATSNSTKVNLATTSSGISLVRMTCF